MKLRHRLQAAEAGRRWAEQKADALEEIPGSSWPSDWDPSWAGELRLHGPRIDPEDLGALIDIANREAFARWAELVERRLQTEDVRGEFEELEARAIWLFEALRGHTPSGLNVGREGARVFLQDAENATEISVSSLGQASRAITEWQERHVGRG